MSWAAQSGPAMRWPRAETLVGTAGDPVTNRCARWVARHADELALAPAVLVTVALMLTIERVVAVVDAVGRARVMARRAVMWDFDEGKGW